MSKGVLILTALSLACGNAETVNEPREVTDPVIGPVARLLVVAGDGQTDTVGRQLTQPVTVKVTDTASKPVPGQVVNFVVTVGGGSVFAGAASTDSAGLAADRWTLGTIAGNQTLEIRAVRSDGTPIVFGTVTATAIAGQVDTASLEPVVGFVGETAIVQPRVTDRFGNPIPWSLLGTALTIQDSLVTPTVVGMDSLYLVARGDTVARSPVSAFLDPRSLGFVIQYTCYDQPLAGTTPAMDSVYGRMSVIPGTWRVEPYTGDQGLIWIDGNRRALLMDYDQFVIRWFPGEAPDTIIWIQLDQQFISGIGPAGIADTVRFSPGFNDVARLDSVTWVRPRPHTSCDVEWNDGTPIVLTATTP